MISKKRQKQLKNNKNNNKTKKNTHKYTYSVKREDGGGQGDTTNHFKALFLLAGVLTQKSGGFH